MHRKQDGAAPQGGIEIPRLPCAQIGREQSRTRTPVQVRSTGQSRDLAGGMTDSVIALTFGSQSSRSAYDRPRALRIRVQPVPGGGRSYFQCSLSQSRGGGHKRVELKSDPIWSVRQEREVAKRASWATWWLNITFPPTTKSPVQLPWPRPVYNRTSYTSYVPHAFCEEGLHGPGAEQGPNLQLGSLHPAQFSCCALAYAGANPLVVNRLLQQGRTS